MPQILSQITHHFDQMNEKKQVSGKCSRCGGMLVEDRCYDFVGRGMVEIAIGRCIQCGDVIDSMILQHRLHLALSEA